jgi:putative tricarboxylic transport membrane protein
LNYISFKGGGEFMVALLVGHVELASANPGEALAQMEAKKVRVLGATTSERLTLAPDIPTLREQGINVVFQQFHFFATPKDIPAEAVKYYEDLFKNCPSPGFGKKNTSKKTC